MDVHTNIYNDEPELKGLIERLNARPVNICVIDDRDAGFKGWSRNGRKFSTSGKVLAVASPSAPRSAGMPSSNPGSALV
jgi:hypothetical protein